MSKKGVRTLDIAWAAGLVEGDGYTSLNGPYRRTPMLGISMTDRDVLEKFKTIFHLPNKIYDRQQTSGFKVYHELKVVGKNAVGLMMTLFPFLCSRRRARIKEVLKIWKAVSGSKREVTNV